MSDTEISSETQKTETTTATTVEVPKTFVGILKANPASTQVSELLHWRDPVKSGLVFGIFNFVFFLLAWADYTVVTLVSYLLLSLLVICVGYANYVVLKASWLQGKHSENPFKERFKNAKFHIPKETVQKHLDTVVDSVNLTVDNFRDIFYASNTVLSLQWIFYFYVAATVGGWFSGLTVLYLATLGAFVWPRLYEEKQKEIDQLYEIAKDQACKYLDLALAKLPPAVTARFPFLKPKAH